MPWDGNVKSGDNIILVDDSIGVKNWGSVDVKDDDADGQRSDDAGSEWAWIGEINLPIYDVGALLLDTDLGLIRGLEIDSLKVALDFEASGGQIIFEVVD